MEAVVCNALALALLVFWDQTQAKDFLRVRMRLMGRSLAATHTQTHTLFPPARPAEGED